MEEGKDLERRLITKRRAGIRIDVRHDPANIFLGEFVEGGAFREDQADKLVIALDMRLLPGSHRVAIEYPRS